jgi:hypothetical protein
MKNILPWKLFEESSTDDDIDYVINYLEDELDLKFLNIRTSPSTFTFIFGVEGSLNIENFYKNSDIMFFIESILKMDFFIKTGWKSNNTSGRVTFSSHIPIGSWSPHRGIFIPIREGDLEKFGREGILDFLAKDIGRILDISLNSNHQLEIEFKTSEYMSLLDWVIKNPDDSDLLSGDSLDIYIKALFQRYCKSYNVINFEKVLKHIKYPTAVLLTPVKKSEITLSYNLSQQFIIDITPVFLKKVYLLTGGIFRLSISRYELNSVTNTDRLSGKSISQETDSVLSELGLNHLEWRDIFLVDV